MAAMIHLPEVFSLNRATPSLLWKILVVQLNGNMFHFLINDHTQNPSISTYTLEPFPIHQ